MLCFRLIGWLAGFRCSFYKGDSDRGFFMRYVGGSEERGGIGYRGRSTPLLKLVKRDVHLVKGETRRLCTRCSLGETRSKVLFTLRRRSSVSRGRLTGHLGMAPPSVASVVGGVRRRNCVAEGTSRRSREIVHLALTRGKGSYVSCIVGATRGLRRVMFRKVATRRGVLFHQLLLRVLRGLR